MEGCKEAYTTKEMVAIFRVTVRAVLDRASRENWQSHPRQGRGGGFEWLVASMPEVTRSAIAFALASASNSSKPFEENLSAPSLSPLGHLRRKERTIAAARKAFVLAIRTLEMGDTRSSAINTLLKQSKEGKLPPYLADLVEVANARYGKGENRSLSRRRLYEWCAAYEKDGEAGLVPRNPQRKMTPPQWLEAFLYFWQRPQKPSIAQAYEEFLLAIQWSGMIHNGHVSLPSYLPQIIQGKNLSRYPVLASLAADSSLVPSIHMVRRWINKMGTVERERGRRTGNDLLSLRPHKLRCTYDLLPGDVYTADGTTADVEVINPLSGKPFRTELTFVLDVATRRCVGVAVGLAEDTLTVLDALRMACMVGGIPALFYTDNGPGYKNKMLSTELNGVLARLGTTPTYSIPARPEGKGLMERAVKTLTERLCKQFASCVHADMDKEAAHRVFKLSRKQIKEAGKSAFHPTWPQFLMALKFRIDQYNDTPHSGLSSIRDCQGKKRFQTPNERWNMFVENNFSPVLLPESIQNELFMPFEVRQVRRGIVQFKNISYFSRELKEWHGQQVEVRYDIWDESKVYIWTLEGVKICEAEKDGNVIPYFDKPVIEKARATRLQKQLKRMGEQVRKIVPGATIELPPDFDAPFIEIVADSVTGPKVVPVPLNSMEQHKEEPLVTEDELVLKPLKRPNFLYNTERYEWLMNHRELCTDTDHHWLEWYVTTEEYDDFSEIYANKGIAWESMQCVANL